MIEIRLKIIIFIRIILKNKDTSTPKIHINREIESLVWLVPNSLFSPAVCRY